MLEEMLKNSKIIGIDIDDTITNSYDKIITLIANHYNIEKQYIIDNGLSYEYFMNNSDLFPNYLDFINPTFESNLYNVELKDNVVEALNLLHEKGYKIVFITARNKDEYKNPYEYTIDYFNRNNIYYDELYTNIKDKGKFAKEHNIDLFIDDSINNCTKLVNNNIKVLLFDNTFNRNNNNNFYRLYNYKEIIDIIKTL